ncbi:hypothetical protein N7491_001898 [Penicillium cf. griseofulvum]|uniref:Uncharacterized protein n=1 Tax=Penicillium cf. griseofulvum TaxID=2972120 RepID=A0A9W9MUB1_9EURO|nr:hypothetical protein N7472_003921 [Penicillium cf. griseofulvum]KAJ5445816.1 hypothetical protein N7491_001898 [Penicillium cf. griseofulvum]
MDGLCPRTRDHIALLSLCCRVDNSPLNDPHVFFTPLPSSPVSQWSEALFILLALFWISVDHVAMWNECMPVSAIAAGLS